MEVQLWGRLHLSIMPVPNFYRCPIDLLPLWTGDNAHFSDHRGSKHQAAARAFPALWRRPDLGPDAIIPPFDFTRTSYSIRTSGAVTPMPMDP
jgi:hypothetical protein